MEKGLKFAIYIENGIAGKSEIHRGNPDIILKPGFPL